MRIPEWMLRHPAFPTQVQSRALSNGPWLPPESEALVVTSLRDTGHLAPRTVAALSLRAVAINLYREVATHDLEMLRAAQANRPQ